MSQTTPSIRSVSRAWARSALSALPPRSPTRSITRLESACAICRSRWISCTEGRGNLSNHLIRLGEEARRNGDAERLGDRFIDHKFEPHRLRNRHLGGLGAVENLPDVAAGLPPGVGPVGAVADQSGRDDIRATLEQGGNFVRS